MHDDITLRDHVIGPIVAGVRSPRMGRKPKIWTTVDRRYETLRIGMQDLFRDLGIEMQPAAACTTFWRSEKCKELRSVRDFARKEWPLRGSLTSRSGIADRSHQSGRNGAPTPPFGPRSGTRHLRRSASWPLAVFVLAIAPGSGHPIVHGGPGSAAATQRFYHSAPR